MKLVEKVCFGALCIVGSFLSSYLLRPSVASASTTKLYGVARGLEGSGNSYVDLEFSDLASGTLKRRTRGVLSFEGENYTIELPKTELADGLYAIKVSSNSVTAGATFVELQTATPGTAQTGHVNLNGTLIASAIKVGNGPIGGAVNIEQSTSGTGLYARSQGNAVYGQNLSTTGSFYGGFFITNSNAGRGIFGSATSPTGSTVGGEFRVSSTAGKGFWGRALAASGTGIGAQGSSASPNGVGLRGDVPTTMTGQGPSNYGVWGTGQAGVRGDGTWGGYFTGSAIGAYVNVTGNADGLFIGSGAGSGITIQSEGTALEVESGEVTKNYGGGAARMVPIAYGYVLSDGSANPGTGNYSISKTQTGIYEITILGYNYYHETFCTLVTLSSGVGFSRVVSNSPKLQILTYNSSGQAADMAFNFVTYKSSGTGPGMPPPSNGYANDAEWAKKNPEEHRKYLAKCLADEERERTEKARSKQTRRDSWPND